MKAIDIVAALLVIVGGLNWGLVGAADFNLVTAVLGPTLLASIVFILVGVAAVYFAIRFATAPRGVGIATPQ